VRRRSSDRSFKPLANEYTAVDRATSGDSGTNFICVTCGSQFQESREPPPECPICLEPRQYVGFEGQKWTTPEELREKHKNTILQEEPGLYSIHTQPAFAIGQRAFLLQTPAGNLLWDCIAFLDPPTIEAIKDLGGVAAIAISHPHYYTTMVDWSLAFGNPPIHLHAADQQWVMRPHANVRFWQDSSMPILSDLALVHTPGHFDGFQVAHWPRGAEGRGVLMSGDQPQVCMDRQWVSFMYSYPNFIPLGPGAIERIVRTLEPYPFDRIYGAFPHRTVARDAKAVIERSAARYLQSIARSSSGRAS
jgi:hypothetical protein